jgi:hypothetical protein
MFRNWSATRKRDMLHKMQKLYLYITSDAARRTVELAARLWLTINIRSVAYNDGVFHPYDSNHRVG